MPVAIRLARAGKKKKPYYHIVAADNDACRDGKYLERLGCYNPKLKTAGLVVDNDAIAAWVKKGAQVSETVGHLLKAASKSK